MHACMCETQTHTPAESFVCLSVLLTCLQGCFLVESPKVQHIKGCPEPLVSNYPFLKVLALGSGALSLCLSISTLSSCSHAVVALLYPFSWQHTFIPVLPASMIDIVCCPTPFLVGLLSSSLPKLKELPVEEVGHLGSQLGAGGRGRLLESTYLRPLVFRQLPSFLLGGLSLADSFLSSVSGNLGGLEAWQRALQDPVPDPLPLTLSQALMVNLGSDRFIRQVRAAHCRTWIFCSAGRHTGTKHSVTSQPAF